MAHLNLQAYNSSLLPLVYECESIPKSIYQTYPSRKLPEAVNENIRRIKKLNPGWTYKLYDDKEIEFFIRTYYGEALLNIYLKINPRYGAARADFFRYLLIYMVGGVYLDIKSSIATPLDSILSSSDRYILAQWGPGDGEDSSSWGRHLELQHVAGGEFQQWHIIAAAGHPFLRSVINEVLRNVQNYNSLTSGVGRMAVLRTTGPIAYTLAIYPLLNRAQFRSIGSSRAFGLIYNGLDGSTSEPTHHSLFKQHYSQLTEPLILNRHEDNP